MIDVGGTVVGVGATAPPGGPHAEVTALREAGVRARGGTAVVTLEPCAHHGRTPPCTEALAAAGVATVVFAVRDPHPRAGGGAAVLRAAGVAVREGCWPPGGPRPPAGLAARRADGPAARHLEAGGHPGRAQPAADGTSRWITGAAARAEVHEFRASVDAIVVGTGTVLADDPSLTARHPDGSLRERSPLRVVVGHRDVPRGFALDAPDVLHLRTHDPDEVLAVLHARGVVDVLLEGGPRLAGAFVAAHRVDRVLAYLAPALLGAGPAALADAGVGTIADIAPVAGGRVRRRSRRPRHARGERPGRRCHGGRSSSARTRVGETTAGETPVGDAGKRDGAGRGGIGVHGHRGGDRRGGRRAPHRRGAGAHGPRSDRVVGRAPRRLDRGQRGVPHRDRGGGGGPTADGPGGTFRVELVPETLARTSLAGVRAGTRVNLERAVAVGGRLGGHIVQGHVDGVGSLLQRDPGVRSDELRFSLPAHLTRYVVEKGLDHRRRGVAHRRRHRRRDVLGGADPDDPDAHHTRFRARGGYRQPRGGRGGEVRRAAHGRVRARR